MKKLLAYMLAVVMILTAMPMQLVFAEPEFISGDDALLNDNIRYTYGQRVQMSYTAPHENTDKFVKFDEVGDGIEWTIAPETENAIEFVENCKVKFEICVENLTFNVSYCCWKILVFFLAG